MILQPRPLRKVRKGHWSSRGLVACWPGSEGDGLTVNDYTENSNNLTIFDGVTWSAGPFGHAFNFPGADSRLVKSGGIHTDYLTFSIWFRRSASDFGTNMVICSDSDPDISWQVFGVSGAGGIVRVRIDTAGGFTVLNTDAFVTANKWHRYVVTFDGTTIIVYLDGVFHKSQVHSNPGTIRNSGNDRMFGVFPNGLTNEFIGEMAYPMIWDKPLSSSQISRLYENQFLMFERENLELWTVSSQNVNVTISPAALGLTASIPSPTIIGDVSISPNALALTTSEQAPDIIGDVTVTPNALALTSSVVGPTVKGDVTISPNALALTSGVPAPSIIGDVVITPNALALTAQTLAATIKVDMTISPAALALIASLPAPTITTGLIAAGVRGIETNDIYDGAII